METENSKNFFQHYFRNMMPAGKVSQLTFKFCLKLDDTPVQRQSYQNITLILQPPFVNSINHSPSHSHSSFIIMFLEQILAT